MKLSPMPDRPVIVEAGEAKTIGYCRFTDGSVRAVRVDEQGRQYVLDDDGEPVVGVWFRSE